MQHKSSTSVISIPVTIPASRILFALALGSFALIGAGCMGDQIDATRQLVQQQQEQLEQQQKEIEALKANQNASYTPGASASSAGGCDKAVETVASQRGGDRFAAADFSKALGYYQDALAACPNDSRAEVNVARTDEALGNKVAAINHYRKAADTAGPTVTDASEEARTALERMQASRLP
jgi:tetratricopeptide (TPR) repeat protein